MFVLMIMIMIVMSLVGTRLKCASACFGSNNSLFIFTTQRSLNFKSSENLKVLTLDFVLFQFIAAKKHHDFPL